MSELCALTKCKRASRALCDCCKQNLCLPHLNDHNVSLISQLNPLIDEINALGNRLQTFNIPKTVDDCRQKLEQWRADCHQKIDRLFEQKCQEFDRLVDENVKKQKEEMDQIQSKLGELVREMEQIYLPFPIDDKFIPIQDISEHELDLSIFSPKTINRSHGNYRLLASNNRFLLIHQAPNLCLIDQEINMVKRLYGLMKEFIICVGRRH